MVEALPTEVKTFLGRYISSIEQLEILLWLFRKGGLATPHDVFNDLKSSEASIGNVMEFFTTQGLCEREGDKFRFAPKTSELRSQVELVDKVYREKRVKVIEAIYSPQGSAIESFSDAFKLKKGKNG
jgi:hypothetical protein